MPRPIRACAQRAWALATTHARWRRSGVDRDLVGDANHAIQPRHVVIGCVALILSHDGALQGDPAVVNLYVDEFRRHVDIPDQVLQRSPADLVVRTAIRPPQADLELVVDLVDALDLASVLGGRSALTEALDCAAQHDE